MAKKNNKIDTKRIIADVNNAEKKQISFKKSTKAFLIHFYRNINFSVFITIL